MAAPDFRICPNCGTRNKAAWEYCARCGEDLHAVPLGAAAAPVVADVEEEPSGGSWLGLVGPLVAIGLVAYAATRLHRPQGAARPDPAIFTIPTVPPSLAAAAPDPATPGLAAYEEGR